MRYITELKYTNIWIAGSANPPQSTRRVSTGQDAIGLARESFLTNTDNHFNMAVKGKKRSQSPSENSHPSSFRGRQLDRNLQIACGRPRQVEETIPVSLLHPAFGQFMDDSRTIIPTAEDNDVTYRLGIVMSALYETENQRIDAVSQVLDGYSVRLHLKSKVPGTQYETDGVMCVDVNNRRHPYVIVEFKNEAAVSNSEPYMQALMYYLQSTRTYAPSLSGSSLPCLLIAIFGPTMLFAGAVWTLRPAIEPLCHSLTFTCHSKNGPAHDTAARHIAAFRNAVRTLERHYETLPPDAELCSKLSHPTIFPYPSSFRSLDDNRTIVFKYSEHLDGDGGTSKRLIFFGTFTDGNDEVAICIKFVPSYSPDAHALCARSGVAPGLRGFERLPGGWFMVVMDRLVEYDILADLPVNIHVPRSVFDAIGEQLKTLHANGLVHGDIRDTNILLKADDRTKYMIIDFDWAGEDKVVRYPAFVNHRDVQRPPGARDGFPVEAAHDDAMLGYIIARRFPH
ncbi:hypothetical protein EDD22DRAFT_789834 [Suillus occidentalis]|nr:hypothetical protein EDD22DRAFT_789834 [Suillus occidentalis]